MCKDVELDAAVLNAGATTQIAFVGGWVCWQGAAASAGCGGVS